MNFRDTVFLQFTKCILKYSLQLLIVCYTFPAAAQQKKLLFADDFSQPFLDSNWIVETTPVKGSAIYTSNGKLIMDTENGVTLWYKQPLSGNIQIEFNRTVIMDSGRNDRLSDLNQFWMATDPQQKMFTRKGGFKEYDSLQMYYVGMGGNYNSTTRMRRYSGTELKIVGEFKDSVHLLQPNKTYHIKIVVQNGVSRFFVDGQLFFDYKDDHPFTSGWFALRSTKSRQEVDDIKIWQLQ
ncbi:MAG: methyltransferase [Bacteroidetes bacterium]|nr:methyltransferase [Bacteroidota bacterium]